ncbi:MAG: PAS domain S-box protein [Desulfobacula sp.]|jgi:PAS domain S-box-containing protein|nr:PAS domain S-box protein [Desulfobacula sp.]
MSLLKTHNKLPFILSIIIYIVAILFYGFWSNLQNKKEILEHVDNKLYQHAISLKYMLPDDFHDRAIDAQSVSIDEDKYIANKLTNLVRETGFKYAYTVIKKEDKLFFVACDLIADPENERGTFYYYEYEGADEGFINAFEKETPTYKTVSDQWGTVRTVMVPEKSPGGINYLACADYDITYVKILLQKNLFKSIATVFFFLLLTIPIIKVYTNSYKIFIGNLKESEEKYRTILESIEDGYYEVDIAGNFTFFNDSMCKILGYSKDELTGLNNRRYTDEENAKQIFKTFNRVYKTGQPYKAIDWELIKKDGSKCYVETSVALKRNSKVQPIGFQGIARDITGRKQAEKALRESEERYRSIFKNAVEGIFQSTPEGRFISVNPAFAKMLGYASPEDLMANISDIAAQYYVNHEDRHRYKQLLQKTGIVKFYEFKARCKDGSHIWVSDSTRVIYDQDGNIVRYEGHVTDITQLKQAEKEKRQIEAQYRQAQKMESVGTLTSGIAHDFNNIMGIILGNTELALEDVPESNPAHTNLEEIRKASLRAANIVRQLLSFTRITDQKLQPIEIAAVIKDAIKFLRSTIPSTIDIEQDICVTDETILADPTQINQIMMNLCINASHAMEQTAGKLTITVENVLLDDDSAKDYPDLKSGKYVKVVVSDTGPGIDPKIIDRIFDPYFTTKGIGKGSGMGLAVVHGIVKSHSGSIKLDNTPGKGTKFSILFPLAQGKATVEAGAIQKIPRGSETILFVDDEISIVNMVQRMFERLGYKVETAITPQDALDRFALNPDHFDLVITDMTMPQMTGVDLSEKLMAFQPDIPIIICTGYSALVDEEKAKELGLAAYVMKPINLSEIAQTIRKVLDRK